MAKIFGSLKEDSFVTVWARTLTSAKNAVRDKGWTIKSAYAEGQSGGWKTSSIYPNRSYRILLGRKK